MYRHALVTALTSALILAGGAARAQGNHEHAHVAHAFPFGEPASGTTPDRTIRIEALDSMRFEPDSFTVEAGEVIEFVVVNKGQIPHSFSLATPEEQEEHEQEMQAVSMDEMMTHMDEEPNGFVLAPGETKTLVWKFTGAGPVQFACHIPGHFPAGMVGEITLRGDDHGHQGGHTNDGHSRDHGGH